MFQHTSVQTSFRMPSVCAFMKESVLVRLYHGQVFQYLDPISWSHVGHMVEVCGVRDQLVPHLWIS